MKTLVMIILWDQDKPGLSSLSTRRKGVWFKFTMRIKVVKAIDTQLWVRVTDMALSTS